MPKARRIVIPKLYTSGGLTRKQVAWFAWSLIYTGPHYFLQDASSGLTEFWLSFPLPYAHIQGYETEALSAASIKQAVEDGWLLSTKVKVPDSYPATVWELTIAPAHLATLKILAGLFEYKLATQKKLAESIHTLHSRADKARIRGTVLQNRLYSTPKPVEFWNKYQASILREELVMRAAKQKARELTKKLHQLQRVDPTKTELAIWLVNKRLTED